MRTLQRKRIEEAATLAKWVLCVPKISPLSPRFTYYVKNWNVLEKIERFEQSGELSERLANSPAFSSAELRASLDYLDQHYKTETEKKAKSRPEARQLESA